MSMNVSTTTAAYANYQNNYKTGSVNNYIYLFGGALAS
jgi:hypothetical protein